jgi:nucleoside-diphosphate-sugar epimerase
VNSITDGSQEQLVNKVFTNKDWNPLTPEDARRVQNRHISYCVSKKESERAIWNFVETDKPHFTVTVFLPCLIMGPALDVDNINDIKFTNNFFYAYFNGTNDRIPPTPFPSYVCSLAYSALRNVILTAFA